MSRGVHRPGRAGMALLASVAALTGCSSDAPPAPSGGDAETGLVAGEATDAEVEPTRALETVRTWGDLIAGEPVLLTNGGQAWLGIEATEVVRGAPVLVYCLVEGGDAGAVPDVDHDDRLGPFRLVVRRPGRAEERRKQAQQLLELYAGRWRLFARSVVVDEVGRVEVEVHRAPVLAGDGRRCGPESLEDAPLGDPILATSLLGRAGLHHPFLSLRRPLTEKATLERAVPGEEPTAAAYLAVTGHGHDPVIPRWEGDRPIFVGDAPRPGWESLPTAIPARPAPGLDARLEGDATILITSERELVLSEAREHWIARYWVDGRAFVPDPEQVAKEEWGHGGGLFGTARRIRLTLDLDAEALGAEPGDVVTVELLYCGGWEHAELERAEKMLERAQLEAELETPLLAPRVEMIAR